ncbi:sulfotransferase [Rheinheimera sp. A13L]|uniref:sulfotransferase n=1 Tax=Rheinheimera sp. A13L TaxID=506534 RepID=UPI0011126776|nr:sulfotransferase [Rheinheimera sp. A13L]
MLNSASIDTFVTLMSDYLDWPDLSFNSLVAFLNQQNQQQHDVQLEIFSRFWQPASYQALTQSFIWAPAFAALSQPFYIDDMQKARQNLLGQLIRPCTKVSDLVNQRFSLPELNPDLVIFHWSRCGSTLLSGALAKDPDVKVVSESMLISQMLMDPHWHASEHQELLDLALRLQGRFRHGEHQLVVKCNAWDLQDWRLWARSYPAANIICLGRDPAKIFSSHQRLSGMHMVPLPVPVWRGEYKPDLQSGICWQVQVLQTLMQQSSQLLAESTACWLDYQQLVELEAEQLAVILRLSSPEFFVRNWSLHKQMDAKQPESFFSPEPAKHDANSGEMADARIRLQQLYQYVRLVANKAVADRTMTSDLS